MLQLTFLYIKWHHWLSRKIFLKILMMQTNICGKKTLLLIETVLCVPQSNAALERFVSQLKHVKVVLVQRVSLKSLNALPHIQATGPSLQIFLKQHTKNGIIFWYNLNEQKIHQCKKRKVRTAHVAKSKHVCFDLFKLFSLLSPSSSSNSNDG